MRAGKLRHRIIIQSRAAGQSASGAANGAWSTWETVWAEVVPLAGRERLQAQLTKATHSHRVSIRYLSGLTTDHRILYGTRTLNIHSVADVDERRREMELLCSEAV